jgi:hypothetical protein
MPRLRKPQPVMLNDDELYAVMRQLWRHVPPHPKGGYGPNKPTGMELEAIQDAYRTIFLEFSARAKEEERISNELKLLDAEYEG